MGTLKGCSQNTTQNRRSRRNCIRKKDAVISGRSGDCRAQM
jgi:hypothetical protein